MNDEASARPSATILILRDGADGLEVFMVVRHHEVDFASGASVFPGGRLAEGDRDPALRGLCDGVEGMDDGQLELAVAAIRESFEECGILLARRPGVAELLGAADLAPLERYRGKFDTGALAMADFLRANELRLACDALVPYANWITPDFAPKRFDTWFFLAAAPAGQIGLHDGTEAVDSIWIRPAQALAEANAGTRPIVFATRMNLMHLLGADSVVAAMAAASGRAITTIQPWLEDRPDGKTVCIPAAAGYPLSEVPVDVARGGPWPDAPG